jgi:hypothetical protein
MSDKHIVYNPSCVPLPPHPTCKRKIAYRSRKRADNALEQMMNKRTVADIQSLFVYLCPHCSKWHLGNRSKDTK